MTIQTPKASILDFLTEATNSATAKSVWYNVCEKNGDTQESVTEWLEQGVESGLLVRACDSVYGHGYTSSECPAHVRWAAATVTIHGHKFA